MKWTSGSVKYRIAAWAIVPGGASDPYVDQAVEQAQRASIVIFSIYTPGAGHFGHSFWRINWGQNHLSQLSDETGGESFYLGSEVPVSLSPYLDDLSRRLLHQYLLTFMAKPVKKSGMQSVKPSNGSIQCGISICRQRFRPGVGIERDSGTWVAAFFTGAQSLKRWGAAVVPTSPAGRPRPHPSPGDSVINAVPRCTVSPSQCE
jgi:hypothetical protein